MKWRPIRQAFVVVHLAVTLSLPLQASELGTAGPFRLIRGVSCEASLNELLNGACDPPSVDAKLTPQQQAAAHLDRAVVLLGLGRFEAAGAAVSQAVAISPQSQAPLLLRARLALSLGRTSDALRDLNATLALGSRNPDALASSAYLHLRQGRLRPALQEATEAVRIAPNNVDALWIRALILIASDEVKPALVELDEALRLEPSEPRSRLLRAEILLRDGQPLAAIEDAKTLLIQRPGDPSALLLRATARASLGLQEGALDDLNELLGTPGRPNPTAQNLRNAGWLYIVRSALLSRLGRGNEALRGLKDAAVDERRMVLTLQLHLREQGFTDVPLDGKASEVFDEALVACFLNAACGRGLSFRA